MPSPLNYLASSWQLLGSVDCSYCRSFVLSRDRCTVCTGSGVRYGVQPYQSSTASCRCAAIGNLVYSVINNFHLLHPKYTTTSIVVVVWYICSALLFSQPRSCRYPPATIIITPEIINYYKAHNYNIDIHQKYLLTAKIKYLPISSSVYISRSIIYM